MKVNLHLIGIVCMMILIILAYDSQILFKFVLPSCLINNKIANYKTWYILHLNESYNCVDV